MWISEITRWVFTLLALVAFAIELWGLIDVLRRPARAYITAEKRTKVFWLALTAAGAFFGYVAIPAFMLFGAVRIGNGLSPLFMIIAVLPAAIYLADVKPEVVRFSGGSGGSGRPGW